MGFPEESQFMPFHANICTAPELHCLAMPWPNVGSWKPPKNSTWPWSKNRLYLAGSNEFKIPFHELRKSGSVVFIVILEPGQVQIATSYFAGIEGFTTAEADQWQKYVKKKKRNTGLKVNLLLLKKYVEDQCARG